MSFRAPPPPSRPGRSQVSGALVANLVGLLLLVAAVAGLVTIAFAYDGRAGWATTCLTATGIALILIRVTPSGEA